MVSLYEITFLWYNLLGGNMRRSEIDRNKLTPMMAQYMEIKDNYEDIILMFRLGDFYEMFLKMQN